MCWLEQAQQVSMLFALGTTLTFATKLHPPRWYLSASGCNSLLIKPRKHCFSYWLKLNCNDHPPPLVVKILSAKNPSILLWLVSIYKGHVWAIFYKWRAFMTCLRQGHTEWPHFPSPWKKKSIVGLLCFRGNLSWVVTCYHRSSTDLEVAQSLRKNSGGLDDNNISQTSGWVTQLGLIPKNSDSCRSYCKDRCSRDLLPPPTPAFHRLQQGKGGYKEISQLELLRWLTLQYSLIGPSLFMATSLIWLLLNRIFPGSTDTDVSKGRCIIFHIVGSICHVIKTVKTLRGKKSKC